MNDSELDYSWANGSLLDAAGRLQCPADAGVARDERLLRFVLHGVLLNVLGAGGLLGNALAVVVLSRPQMRSSVNCLLVGLAAADTVLIVTSVLLFGLSALYPYTGHLRHYYYVVCPLLTPLAYPLALVAQTMSVYLTLVVTLERWVAVCHPFRAKALCTSARARWYVLGVGVFSLAYNAPKFLEVAVERRAAPGLEPVYCVTATPFRTPLYVTVYIHWLYLLVMYIVPFSLLAALNACIVRQVRRAQAERARLSRGQRRELGLATMLLVVVLVFFLCNLLPLFTNAFEVFLEPARLDALDPLVKTSNLLVMINSSVNFVIYVIFGEKFKRVFLKMFCSGRCARPRRESPEHTRDDSLASCGERVSLRLVRNGTLRRSRGAGGGGGHGGRGGRGTRVYYPGAEATSLTALSERAPPAAPAPPAAAARWNGHANDHF
ncbi:FMRFamide receptor [Plutella xylostella]|uniref:FMRFamide receptor n=1 Tax=Plutella xylostella TaxID=51655 RepID=UPI002032CCE7|nr:FMRFamide receptor [Plutella xylostella]